MDDRRPRLPSLGEIPLALLGSLGGAAVLASLVVASSASAASGAIKVSPSAAGSGTTFTVSFVAPFAEPALGYEAILKAAGGTHKNSCVGKLTFRLPPESASAGMRLNFTFKPSAASQLCTGAWNVSVEAVASGATVLTGGHFKLT